MSFTLTMSGVIVGRSELESRDPASRIARGTFRPGLGYELAQPIFELYDSASGDADALTRYRRARQALQLQLEDSSGAPVSVRDLHVRRATSESAAAGLVIEVESDDPSLWNRPAQS